MMVGNSNGKQRAAAGVCPGCRSAGDIELRLPLDDGIELGCGQDAAGAGKERMALGIDEARIPRGIEEVPHGHRVGDDLAVVRGIVLPVLVTEGHRNAQDEPGQGIHVVTHLDIAQGRLGDVAEHDAVEHPTHPALAHETPKRGVLLLHGGDASDSGIDERQYDDRFLAQRNQSSAGMFMIQNGMVASETTQNHMEVR